MHNSGRGLSKAAKEGSEEMKKALKALSYSVPRIWWRRRELNPRPETFFCWFYMPVSYTHLTLPTT